ncbi:MAG: hypothetical protein JNJ57_04795 [Saprospiraceae bacterium]|nr:hypothetical protein [Saprospiraceae bacterium]
MRSHASFLLERFGILHPALHQGHSSIGGYFRQDAASTVLKIDSLNSGLAKSELGDLQFLANDNNEWIPSGHRLLIRRKKPLAKVLYATPAHLFEVNTRDFHLRLNPMLNLTVGEQQDNQHRTYQNQRGLELRGDIDQKVYFYTNLVESQAAFSNYEVQFIRNFKAIPGIGFYKLFNSKTFKNTAGYDFNIATAYLGAKVTKHIALELGHGRHFIGNGYRSMLLSDFAAPAFYLKLNTRFKRFHYQNLFLELSPVSQVDIPDGTILPKKYAAMHYLSIKATDRLSLGFFETTVFHRSKQFEWQYLNPVIFYRTVEGMIGSPDNVLLGFNFSYNLLKKSQLYGQFLFDEFRLAEVFGNRGWWANKQGFQFGVKHLNTCGIDHLDVQLEFNAARPYTYAHSAPEDSYTHYNQALAHPLGANFRELLGILRYQYHNKWFFTASMAYMLKGDDTAAQNWGGNPLISYNSRVQEYGNKIGQGIESYTTFARFDVSWMWSHNLFIDASVLHRRKNSQSAELDMHTNWFKVGMRMNLWPQEVIF